MFANSDLHLLKVNRFEANCPSCRILLCLHEVLMHCRHTLCVNFYLDGVEWDRVQGGGLGQGRSAQVLAAQVMMAWGRCH